MQVTGKANRASLAWLIWWSVRLAWARNKVSRRRFRHHIWTHLSNRWLMFMPDTLPGTEVGIVRAVWLGASLASRSLVRYPLLPPRIKKRLMWLVRVSGRTNGKAIIAAYLAWVWLHEVAFSSTISSETWGKIGG